ncbi:MAG: energy transducer TonB [Candidatus Delongbacteria bacterium]|nr:energy transducer TonB [Candidatus Delongbacteria bacterium]
MKNLDYDLRAINSKWLTESLVVILAMMLLMFVTWVTFSVEILPQAKPRIEVQVENIPQTQQTTAAPPPERPAVPIESEDEDLPDDVTISSTTIDFTEQNIAPPTASSAEDEEIPEFVAFDKAPEVLKQVPPEYPEIARRAGIEGDVWLRVPIDTSGNVIGDKIKVVKNTTGNSGCVEAAIAAAKQYKLSPAYQRDRPVRVWISLPFKFRLKDR